MADPDEAYRLVALADNELQQGIYYVKDTTKFYQTYTPNGNARGTVKLPDSRRLFWLDRDESLIPTMYADGIIAYASDQSKISNISLERYADIGYSFGLVGAEIDEDGYIVFELGNCIKDTDIYNVLSTSKGKKFRIVSINGVPVTPECLNRAGMITGLEENGSYEIAFYAGSYYGTTTIQADRHFFSSFEVYEIPTSEYTKNGYLSLNMPSECPSGYYFIQGSGLFKYYNTEKGNTPEDVDMNEAYYTSSAEQIKANSQQYVVSVSTTALNVGFLIEYEQDYDDSEVVGVLTAPDGTTYQLIANGGQMYIEIEQAMAGRWTINIAPQDLQITNITPVSLYQKDDSSQQVFVEHYEENTNKTVYVHYDGSGDIWGTITFEDGSAKELTNNKKGYLYASYDYMAEGDYTITIYHYADTAVEEPFLLDNEEELETSIITVESD